MFAHFFHRPITAIRCASSAFCSSGSLDTRASSAASAALLAITQRGSRWHYIHAGSKMVNFTQSIGHSRLPTFASVGLEMLAKVFPHILELIDLVHLCLLLAPVWKEMECIRRKMCESRHALSSWLVLRERGGRFVHVFFCLAIIRIACVVEVNVHIIFDTLIVNI